MTLDKQKEIEPERFWEDVGAISVLIVLGIEALPVVPFVVWIQLLQGLDKMLGVAALIAFAPFWVLSVFLLTDRLQRYVRRSVVKDKIRGMERRRKESSKQSESIRELQEWIRKQGYYFKGETEEDVQKPRREENAGQT